MKMCYVIEVRVDLPAHGHSADYRVYLAGYIRNCAKAIRRNLEGGRMSSRVIAFSYSTDVNGVPSEVILDNIPEAPFKDTSFAMTSG